MSSRPSDSIEIWIDHAERSLFDLASQLRRIPLESKTKPLHLRALELKREVASWRGRVPDLRTRAAVLDEIEQLAREAQRHRRFADRRTSLPRRRWPGPASLTMPPDEASFRADA
ncbi:MAG TPA: hypothetical protein VM925_00715 [Labilithrix sp.]|nr:hypothetical protein [Labilithrix sp.]